jgi:hypothetical protein
MYIFANDNKPMVQIAAQKGLANMKICELYDALPVVAAIRPNIAPITD